MPDRALRIIAGVALSTALIVGCSNAPVSKPAAQPTSKPDVSALDSGPYSTQPRLLGNVESEDEGRAVEAMRMQETVPEFTKIDPSLIYFFDRSPLTSSEDIARSMSWTGEALVLPVLDEFGAVAAYSAGATDVENFNILNVAAAQDPRFVNVIVTRFPDEESATAAAREIERVDFAVNSENVRVPITKFPEAQAHWRPSNPTMMATLARGEFVVHAFTRYPTLNYGALVGLIEKTLGATLPLVDDFAPTPVDKIATMPRDPDDVLGMLLDLEPGGTPSVSRIRQSFGPNGVRANEIPQLQKDRVSDRVGADLGAVWLSDASFEQIVRVRDHAAAIDYVDTSARLDPDISGPVDGPKGVPGAKCFESTLDAWAETPSVRFGCFVVYDRYAAWLTSESADDVKLRATAQYALLVNAL